jgi:hypothetical protein
MNRTLARVPSVSACLACLFVNSTMSPPEESDCLSCRVVGSGVCAATSATLALQLYRGVPPVSTPAHRAALVLFSAGFAAMGVVRALM